MTLFLAAVLLGSAAAFGQAPTTPPTPAPTQGDKPSSTQAAPLTLEASPPPVSAEEEAAMKAYRDVPNDDPAKKEQAGLGFLQKYPQSRYRAEIYNWQVKYYFSKGQIDKMEEAGDKELALAPTDAQTLAIMGSALPRAMNANTPEPQKRLAKAEQYSQKALELIPTYPKPDNMTEDAFVKAKNLTSAMAYSGLGTVAFRRGKFADAIPQFEQAIKLDPQPDSVNYYLLGVCNEKASHFEDAVAAFTKCSEIPGGLQAACKTGIDEAKKLATTQLSSPK
jgi:tetratricopeptide (TPR) repeat protein